MSLQSALLRLDKGGPERQAIEAGEIDAIIDYSSSNVILFPAARRALREVANRTPGADRESVANSLLAALPLPEYRRLLAGLVPVTLRFGNVLYEPGETIRHVYFPLFLAGETTPSRAIVQSAGSAYRLRGDRLKQEFNRHGQMLHLLLRYTQALITQMSQTAVCNRHHSVDQQLCRWLLLSLDRLPSNRLTMTQELIANMLGVRREGVTEAAGKLQELGVIKYTRGQITVLDRLKLEEMCCECYAVVKKETDRLRPHRAAN